MKNLKSLFLAMGLIATITFIGSGLSSNGSNAVNAQDTMLGRAGDKITEVSKDVGKKTWKGTRKVGTTVGNRTWTGTKWVASKSWKGGKWVAIKTKNGTKWVYRKGKNTVKGATRGARKP